MNKYMLIAVLATAGFVQADFFSDLESQVTSAGSKLAQQASGEISRLSDIEKAVETSARDIIALVPKLSAAMPQYSQLVTALSGHAKALVDVHDFATLSKDNAQEVITMLENHLKNTAAVVKDLFSTVSLTVSLVEMPDDLFNQIVTILDKAGLADAKASMSKVRDMMKTVLGQISKGLALKDSVDTAVGKADELLERLKPLVTLGAHVVDSNAQAALMKTVVGA